MGSIIYQDGNRRAVVFFVWTCGPEGIFPLLSKNN